MALTRAELVTLRDAWLAAELACATGQSYTIGGRTLTRADARFAAEQRAKYQAQLDAFDAGRGQGARVIYGVPRDT